MFCSAVTFSIELVIILQTDGRMFYFYPIVLSHKYGFFVLAQIWGPVIIIVIIIIIIIIITSYL
jgi:hypothetical protein